MFNAAELVFPPDGIVALIAEEVASDTVRLLSVDVILVNRGGLVGELELWPVPEEAV